MMLSKKDWIVIGAVFLIAAITVTAVVIIENNDDKPEEKKTNWVKEALHDYDPAYDVISIYTKNGEYTYYNRNSPFEYPNVWVFRITDEYLDIEYRSLGESGTKHRYIPIEDILDIRIKYGERPGGHV